VGSAECAWQKETAIVGMQVLSHGQTLLAATEKGYGKRTSIDEYPMQKRGGKGCHHHQDQ
jgi:DNA gyrase/topoisomerase IV subunit A